jgi:predicted RNA-binding Zn-ribbon protein involved in translation (DUF1610 family)
MSAMIRDIDPRQVRRVPVRAVRVDYLCPECGVAMEFDGMAKPSSTPWLHHVCPNGHDLWILGDQGFPRI